jgi:hypothetical protein
MRGVSMTEEQLDRAAQLYEQDWSVARIGNDLGVNGGTVSLGLRA